MSRVFGVITGSVAVVIILLGIAACSPADEKKGMDNAKASEIKPVRYSVEMAMMKFTPAVLNVRKGDTIVFVNNDIVTHDITEQKEKAWSSLPLTAGKSWTMVATTTVDYYCSIHPVMTGKIIVE